MPAEFDLHLTSLFRLKGKEWRLSPGLLTTTPPRRAARSRRGDNLLIFVSLSGNAPVTSNEFSQITSQLAERFYQNAGALTTALRNTAEGLNQALVERNLKTTGKGQFLLARLLLGVLHGRQFIFLSSGPLHVYHLTSLSSSHLYDEGVAGKGLGYSQTAPLYFSQAELHTNDLVVLFAGSPKGWEEALQQERSLSTPNALQSKLLNLNNADVNAVLIQAQTGSGKVNILSAKPSAEIPPPITPTTFASQQSQPGALIEAQAHRQLSQPLSAIMQPPEHPVAQPISTTGPSPTRPVTQPEEAAAPPIADGAPVASSADMGTPEPGAALTGTMGEPSGMQGDESQSSEIKHARSFIKTKGGKQFISAPDAGAEGRSDSFTTIRDTASIPEISRPASNYRSVIFLRMARGLQTTRRFFSSIADRLRHLVPRLLIPQQENDSEPLSRSSLAFIAILVPLLLITVAVMVYMSAGRDSQYEENYSLAVKAAVGAIGTNDPANVRLAWESTLYYLDKAEAYQLTNDSQALRWQAQAELDNLDRIVRLNFQPAIISGLAPAIHIGRMAASDSDLYLLDTASGSVLHTIRTNQGYEVNPDFKCGPGVYENGTVGGLVDFVVINNRTFANANLIGIDSAGNLLFCNNSGEARAIQLPSPGLGWKNIAAITLDAESKTLYVLDPTGAAVWSYFWVKDKFEDPNLFFGDQVPQGMNTALDLAMRGEDLFLLFQDGHMASCVGGGRCVDPIQFEDPRAGHLPGASISDAVFSQLLIAGPSDPSLYMLESLTKAVFRFNVSPDKVFSLQSQFQATADQRTSLFTSPVSSMAISPNRYIFLSVDNRVYFATDMP